MMMMMSIRTLSIMMMIMMNVATTAFVVKSSTTWKTTSSASALSLFNKKSSFKASSSSSSSSPLVEQALNKYPFVFRPAGEARNAAGRPKIATSETEARAAFNELARLYGDQQALDMVSIQPLILCFPSNDFGPCLTAWSEKFGEEQAKAMVYRNPGLLGVPPILAAEADESTMAASYVIAATRPSLPKFIALTAFLLYVFHP